MVNVAGDVPADGFVGGVPSAPGRVGEPAGSTKLWVSDGRAPADLFRGSGRRGSGRQDQARGNCCPLYHEAVELVGRRWTGAILSVLMDGPLRFSEIASAIPELSDRLLSERMKELEAPRDGGAHRHPRASAAGSVRALDDGLRARAGADRDPALGAALAGGSRPRWLSLEPPILRVVSPPDGRRYPPSASPIGITLMVLRR